MSAHSRVIAVDPSPRGFGFAVLEGRELVDWGLAHVRGDKNAESLRRLAGLVSLYRPDALALEDCAALGCRRRSRPRTLIADMLTYGEFAGLALRVIGWRTLKEAVGGDPKATKEVIAARVVGAYPELADFLPPHRKAWMSEDPRMSIFDAVALAMASSRHTMPISPLRTS